MAFYIAVNSFLVYVPDDLTAPLPLQPPLPYAALSFPMQLLFLPCYKWRVGVLKKTHRRANRIHIQ